MSRLPDTTTLQLREDLGVLHVTLDRPHARNAINAQLRTELSAVLAHAEQRRGELRAVVVRGAGGTFCAGADLKGFGEAFGGGSPDRAAIVASNRVAGEMFAAFARLPQVTVAVVEGAAMGGGVGLAAGADVVLTTAEASWSTTETTLGLVPAQIIPHLLARLGPATARRLTLTAARLDGTAAAACGLADVVTADTAALDAELARTLHAIRRCAPEANATTKDLLALAADGPPEEYADRAAEVFGTTLLGPEAREGVTAFVERRDPSWRP